MLQSQLMAVAKNAISQKNVYAGIWFRSSCGIVCLGALILRFWINNWISIL